MVPRKLLSRLLRAWPLILLPIILAPALVLGIQNARAIPAYQSTATIWVLDPEQIQRASLDVQNVYLTPAQRQASVLRDLLLTQSFRLQIAARAGVIATPAPVAGTTETDPTYGLTEAQRRTVSTAIGKALAVSTNGANLLTVTSTYREPSVAQSLGAALIATYDQRLRTESTRQDAINLDYFDRQLSVAEVELAERKAAVAAYIRANPNINLSASGDLEYRSLVGKSEAQDAIVNSLNEAVQTTHLNAVAASQALAARFNVLDQPSLPARPIAPSRMQQFGLPGAGMVLGALLAGAYLLTVYRLDHSIGSTEDLRGIGVPFLGYAPVLNDRPVRWWRRSGEPIARQTAASFALRKAM